MFHYKNNKLYCENVPVEKIASAAGTPVYIYSKKQVIGNYLNLNNAFKSISHLICYAMKANSNHAILKTLFSLGAGADITSGGELYRALRAGVPPDKIVFAGVGKTKEEIEYALKIGILMFNVESTEEIELISRISRQIKRKTRIAIRVNPDIDPHTHKHITTSKAENKFGIPYEQAASTAEKIRKDKNLILSGLHCHLGSQIISLSPYIQMAKKLSLLVKQLTARGMRLEYLDIGGGLGIKYHNEKPPTPYELAESILPVLKNLNLKLILENGRYIVGNSGILLTKVIYHKSVKNKKFLIVNSGMTDLIRPAFYDAYHEIVPAELGKSIKTRVDVVGPICESSDYLGRNRLLPWNSTDQLLAVLCAGAYCFSMSSQYNSRPRPPEVMVEGNKWKIIRKRETFKDLEV